MIFDPDIFRAAKLLIERHGENAPMRAARRADDLLEAGDATIWRQILEAIEEITRGRKPGEPDN